MESFRKTAAVAALGLATLTGCGGKVVMDDIDGISVNAPDAGNDAGNDADAGINENVDLTRAQFAQSMVGEILGISSSQTDCVSSFTDVPGNSELCKAVELLGKRGAMTGYKNADGQLTGLWGPNDPITREQSWKVTTRAIGFAEYPAECIKNYPDFSPTAWSTNYLGSLCDHGFKVAKQDGLLHAPENIKVNEWNDTQKEFSDYLSGKATRSSLVEATQAGMFGKSAYDGLSCIPSFSDVPANSFLCVATNDLVENGLLDGNPSNGKFRPNDLFNLAELSKIFAETGATTGKLSGNGEPCFQGAPDSWYYSYAQTMCQNGLIAPDADMSSNPSRRFTYETIWKINDLQ